MSLPSHTTSLLQRAVLDFVASGSGHGIVEATAGSGKTTTLVKVAELLEASVLRPGQRACFLAFNRSTALELRTRLPESVDATTIHALGRTMLSDSLAGGRIVHDDNAYIGHAHDVLDSSTDMHLARLDPAGAATYLARLAGLARLELTDVDDPAALTDLVGRYRLRSPAAEHTPALNALLADVLRRGHQAGRSGTVDFTDMVYLPLHYGLPPPQYAFVCVDEAQDLSRLNLELVMRLLAEGARGLFVGDPFQAIYAFAGADARSLERIATRTAATLLPLSVSYRCPVRHVALARRFSPTMTTRSGAPTGSVAIVPAAALPRSVRPGDLVMSRTNAPLLSLAIAFASRGTPNVVLGDELATETVALARLLFPTGRLDEWREVVDEADTAAARELERRLLTDETLPRELDRSADRFQVLRLALDALERRWLPPAPQEGVPETSGSGTRRGSRGWWRDRLHRWLPSPARPTVDDLATVLVRLLGGADEAQDGGGDGRYEHPGADGLVPSPTAPVVLSTIHKAKGREADRVFLYHADQLGLTTGNAEDDLSEGNVLFVALTRARHELVLVESNTGALTARLARGAGARYSPAAADPSPPDERWRGESDPRGPAVADSSALHRQWDDVLRLATIMAAARPVTGPTTGSAPILVPGNGAASRIIRYAATRRVQDPRRQAGGGRRGGGGR